MSRALAANHIKSDNREVERANTKALLDRADSAASRLSSETHWIAAALSAAAIRDEIVAVERALRKGRRK